MEFVFEVVIFIAVLLLFLLLSPDYLGGASSRKWMGTLIIWGVSGEGDSGLRKDISTGMVCSPEFGICRVEIVIASVSVSPGSNSSFVAWSEIAFEGEAKEGLIILRDWL